MRQALRRGICARASDRQFEAASAPPIRSWEAPPMKFRMSPERASAADCSVTGLTGHSHVALAWLRSRLSIQPSLQRMAREKLPNQFARVDLVTGCEVAGAGPDMSTSLGERRIGPVKYDFGACRARAITNLGDMR